MERWVPLFDILMNSTCPESDASHWLQQSFNSSSSSSVSITTSSFLALLTKPTNTILLNSSSSALQNEVDDDVGPLDHPKQQTKQFMWIQTLPNAVQARILSFLVYECKRFCALDLSKLAKNMLSDDQELDFWVKRAAQLLLDVVSDSNNIEWISSLNLGCEGEKVHEEFEALPDWLKQAAADCDVVFPWLPVLSDEFSMRLPVGTCGNFDDDSLDDIQQIKEEDLDKARVEVDLFHLNDDPIDPETERMATMLKFKMLHMECTSKVVELVDEIRKLCSGRCGNSLGILSLIEPWQTEDETASIIISNFSDGSKKELYWPSHVLCSIVLPKLLVLEEPASRVLMTATIEYCKLHQKSAVNALLYPLILRKEGVNHPISDVIARVIKECLHPAHVSSFCQKLLCGEEDAEKFICLPCHRYLISDELVWNEDLFSLFHIILNHNVHLTEDSVAQLVHHVGESAQGFGKSLKFGNFLLCLVSKCALFLRPHKLSLIRAAEHTNTIVTKSLVSKLAGL